jgi:hypothetical protein
MYSTIWVSGYRLIRVLEGMTEPDRTERAPRFTEPRANLIQSDAGFSLEVLGRTGLRYVENGKVMIVDSEVLAAPGAIAVFRDSIKRWEPPDDTALADDSERSRISANIERALVPQGYEPTIRADWDWR